MKIIFAIILLVSLQSKAANWYFNNTGNDITGDGSIGTPYQSITKLNAIWLSGTLAPGDSILFRRGQEFYGKITVSESGSLGAPIILSGYGSGSMPVITGFVTLASWTNLGSGLYEINNSALGSTLNMVTVNGISYSQGRYPNANAANKGYLTFENHTGNTSITDNQLTGIPDWTGADLVVRVNRYIMDKRQINDHGGATLAYSPGLTYTPSNGFGYIITNDIQTLDQFGEWFYNPGTQKVTMFFGASSPASYTLKATAVDTLFNMYNFDNVVINGLSFQGANMRGMNFYSVDIGVSKVLNSEVRYCGEEAIVCGTSRRITIDNCLIEDANQQGIWCSALAKYTITNNTINRIAIFPAMMGGVNTNTAIRCNADSSLIQYNYVDSAGYVGIRFAGEVDTVTHNYVTHYCTNLDDGGGIYTVANGLNSIVKHNIVINGNSALEGTTATNGATNGIYLDDNTRGVTVDSNSIANNNLNGIFVHNSYNCNIRYNTVYNSTKQQILFAHNTPQSNIRGLVMKKNILVSKISTAYTIQSQTDASDINYSLWATSSDSNYHARPINQSLIIRAVRPTFMQDMIIGDWYTLSAQDQHSVISPKTYLSTINPDDSIRFEYNNTKTNKVVTLPGTYTDVKGNSYVNTITLQPFTSAVLMTTGISGGTSTAPAVNITLPTNGATYATGSDIVLNADASDDGAINTVKFYNGASLLATLTAEPYSFVWTAVPAGTYSLTAVALDNTGEETTSSAISVTVSDPVAPTGPALRINKILIVQ